VKKALTSMLMLFGILAGLLIGGSSASATGSATSCSNKTILSVSVVVCDIDVNDNNVLDGNDIWIEVLNYVANNNEINALTVDLDNLTINVPVTATDVVNIKNVVVQDLVVVAPVINIGGCGCPH